MKKIGERISVVDDKKKTTVIIYPERKPWVLSLMGAWVMMWYAIGISLSVWYFSREHTQEESIMVLVFMSFWVYYAIRVSRTFFWLMFGTEFLKIDDISLTVKRSIKGYGRATEYYVENIKKIRVNAPKTGSFQETWEASPWIKGGERIEFDYLNKTGRFGRKLNEKDAKLLFNLLTKRIEEKVRKKKD